MNPPQEDTLRSRIAIQGGVVVSRLVAVLYIVFMGAGLHGYAQDSARGVESSKKADLNRVADPLSSKHNWIAIGEGAQADLFIDSRIIEYCAGFGATETISVLTKRRITRAEDITEPEQILLNLDAKKAARAAYFIDTEMYNLAVPKVKYIAIHCYDEKGNLLGFFSFENAGRSEWRKIGPDTKPAKIYDSARRIFSQALKVKSPK